eukprot:1997628-Pyramimonas_sp.AAC.2
MEDEPSNSYGCKSMRVLFHLGRLPSRVARRAVIFAPSRGPRAAHWRRAGIWPTPRRAMRDYLRALGVTQLYGRVECGGGGGGCGGGGRHCWDNHSPHLVSPLGALSVDNPTHGHDTGVCSRKILHMVIFKICVEVKSYTGAGVGSALKGNPTHGPYPGVR